MPIDYSLYPPNWKTEIRPAVLKRACNRCEQCMVPNYSFVCRGRWNGVDVYQDDEGGIFNAETGVRIGDNYVGEVWNEKDGGLVKIILTVAHLDHDPENHQVKLDRLKALCQRCHLRLDAPMKSAKRRQNKLKNQPELPL